MRFSREWLNKHLVDKSITDEQIIEVLNRSGIETKLVDGIYEVTPLTNRSDLKSIVGIARELNNLEPIKKEFKLFKTNLEVINETGIESKHIEVQIEELVEEVEIDLKRIGLYSNNININLYNYILIETGIPINIYEVRSNKLYIRKEGNNIVTIDNKFQSIGGEYNNYPISKHIYIEVIKYPKEYITRINNGSKQLFYGIELGYNIFDYIRSIIKGTYSNEVIVNNKEVKPTLIEVSSELYRTITGEELKEEYFNKKFKTTKTIGGIIVEVPIHRKDLTIPHQIIEETLKGINKYNSYKETDKRNTNIDTIRIILNSIGFEEIMTNPLEENNLIRDYYSKVLTLMFL